MPFATTIPFATTLRVRDTCLCLHAQRAARSLARRFDKVLRPLGLTNGQFSLLMALNRPEPADMSGVAALLAMDRTTLTAALKPLQRQGLVDIRTAARDKRVHALALTAEGTMLLAKAVPVWEATHAAAEAVLGPAQTQRLRRDLAMFSGEWPAGRSGQPEIPWK